MEEVFVKASHRLELGGDWSDLPEYYQRYGGRVINVAIDIPELVIEVSATLTTRQQVEIVSIDRERTENFPSLGEIQATSPQTDPLFLLKAALRYWQQAVPAPDRVDYPHFLREGKGLRLVTRSTAPAGSGLGTSSILGAALLLALSRLAGRPWQPRDACWRTFEMERACKLGNGWQDQVGGILPGIKDITCPPDHRFMVENIVPPNSFLEKFSRFTVLVCTKQTRFSGTILNQVNHLIRSDPQTVTIIDSLKSMCDAVRQAIRLGQYDEIGVHFQEMTDLQRRLHPSIVPEHVLDLFKRTECLCYGARICGAGGNGFLAFFSKGDAERAALVQLLETLGYTGYSCTAGLGARFLVG